MQELSNMSSAYDGRREVQANADGGNPRKAFEVDTISFLAERKV